MLVQVPAPLEQLGLDRGGELVESAESGDAAAALAPCCA